MILIGIGSNLAAAGFASPLDTAAAALARLSSVGIAVVRRSRWYMSQPVPPSDQPWYVNGVVAVETALAPLALLDALLAVEAGFGRRRGAPNAARTLDLDLLDYDGTQCVERAPRAAAPATARAPLRACAAGRNRAAMAPSATRGKPPPSCWPLCRRGSSRFMQRPIRPP